MDDRICAEMPIEELALGLLDGRERAQALDHLAVCPRCRQDVAATTAVADRLAHLAPEAEPPAGFESAVMARLRPAPVRTHRRWSSRIVLGSVAAALAVVVAVGATLLATRHHAPGQPARLTAALTADGGRNVGTVELYLRAPRWLSMSVHGLGVTGTVRCEVQAVGDDDVYTGSFPLRDGQGAWTAPLPRTGTVLAVDVEDASGHVLASTARLP